jgi:hypothetical protein
MVIRQMLVITLIVTGLGLLGWALTALDLALLVLPMAIGGLATGLCLYLLQSERDRPG